MKLLLILVLIIAVITVDCRDFSDETDGSLGLAAIEIENHNSAEADPKPTLPTIENHIIQNEARHSFSRKTGQILPRKAGSGCKAKVLCIIMGGSCVTNATLCQGRLVPGCKGKRCQCCVHGTLETKIHHLEQNLQTMQANLSNANLKISMELKTLEGSLSKAMRENTKDVNSKLITEFKTMRENLSNSNSILSMEFESMREDFNISDSKLNMKFKTMREDFNDSNSKLFMEFKSMGEDFNDSNSKLNMEFKSMGENFNHSNSKLNMEFKSMKENFNDSNAKLNMEFKSMRENLNDSNAKLNMEFKSMRENLTETISKIITEFQSMRDNLTDSISNSSMPNTQCDGVFFRLGADCLHVGEKLLSWEDARKSCRNMSSDLAVPNDIPTLKAFLKVNRTSSSYWLGGSDADVEGTWKWLNGTIITKDWQSGQPGGGAREQYLCLYPHNNSPGLCDCGTGSSWLMKFVCER